MRYRRPLTTVDRRSGWLESDRERCLNARNTHNSCDQSSTRLENSGPARDVRSGATDQIFSQPVRFCVRRMCPNRGLIRRMCRLRAYGAHSIGAARLLRAMTDGVDRLVSRNSSCARRVVVMGGEQSLSLGLNQFLIYLFPRDTTCLSKGMTCEGDSKRGQNKSGGLLHGCFPVLTFAYCSDEISDLNDTRGVSLARQPEPSQVDVTGHWTRSVRDSG